MSIYVNKSPHGKVSSIGFGFNQILDGLVRVVSFGFLCSTFALDHARETARSKINRSSK